MKEKEITPTCFAFMTEVSSTSVRVLRRGIRLLYKQTRTLTSHTSTRYCEHCRERVPAKRPPTESGQLSGAHLMQSLVERLLLFPAIFYEVDMHTYTTGNAKTITATDEERKMQTNGMRGQVLTTSNSHSAHKVQVYIKLPKPSLF